MRAKSHQFCVLAVLHWMYIALLKQQQFYRVFGFVLVEGIRKMTLVLFCHTSFAHIYGYASKLYCRWFCFNRGSY